jgi:hypothetical protein
MHVFKARVGGFTFRQTKIYELTYFDVRNGQSVKFGLFKLFPKFCAKKNVDTKKIAPAAPARATLPPAAAPPAVG